MTPEKIKSGGNFIYYKLEDYEFNTLYEMEQNTGIITWLTFNKSWNPRDGKLE